MTDREERSYLFGQARSELDAAAELIKRARINMQSARGEDAGSVSQIDFAIDMACNSCSNALRDSNAALIRLYEAMKRF